MRSVSTRACLAGTLVTVISLLALVSSAAPAHLTSLGPAGSPDERLARLQADDLHRVVTTSYVTRAKIALGHARDLRMRGSVEDAALAEQGAVTWLDAAEELVRAVDLEDRAATLELGSLDAGARVDRERALLEEALATAGRRRAELARIERERTSSGPRLRTADIDGGAAVSAGAADGGGFTPARGLDGGAFQLHLPGRGDEGNPGTDSIRSSRRPAGGPPRHPAEESPP